MTLVVNLFAGPGTGKSTIAAGVFSELKWAGINCELVTEYAKGKVWEDTTAVLADQLYLLGKQHHRQFLLQSKVDVMITDSPLLLLLEYGSHWGPEFKAMVLAGFNSFNNVNYFLRRRKTYNPLGRLQTEQEAIDIDARVFNIIKLNDINYSVLPATKDSIAIITEDILRRINGRREFSTTRID